MLKNGGEKSLKLRNKMGRTPLELARWAKHWEVAKLLEAASREAGAAAADDGS